MAVPTQITVTGTYLRPDGEPSTGTAEFTSHAFVRHALSDDVMAPGTIPATLVDGELSVPVPATDDPDWSPDRWTWLVTLRLDGNRPVEFSAAIPYDSPGGTLDLSALLPVPESGGELYAPVAHTHAAYLLKTGGTITGNLFVQDVGGDKSYGLRVTGAALDLDAAGVDLYIGVFEGAGNTGVQHKYLRLEAGVQLAHAIGRWQFAKNEFGGTVLDIDAEGEEVTVEGVLRVATTGTIKFGANEDANLYRVGPDYIATDGKVAAGLDIECWDAGHGLVLHDRVGDAAYRLKVTSGVLGIEAV